MTDANNTVTVSQLNPIPSGSISDEDLLLFTDSSSTQSLSLSIENLKVFLRTEGFFSTENLNDLETSINTSNVEVNATLLDGQPASYYLDYTNLDSNTTPDIPTNVSELNNDLGFITNLSAFTTDSLAEGDNNLYFTNTRFDERFNSLFLSAYRNITDEYTDENPLDSVIANATPSNPNVLTDTVILSDTSLASRFYSGQSVRVYGASGSTNPPSPATGISITVQTNGFTGVQSGNTEFSYYAIEVQNTDGKIVQKTGTSPTATGINTEEFNNTNNVTLTINKTSSDTFVLVYRKINNDLYRLIDVLGEKESNDTTIIYVDYFDFNLNAWSGKNTNNAYLSGRAFPFKDTFSTDYGTANRGWESLQVEAINTNSGQIIFTQRRAFDGNIQIAQNDTNVIQSTITSRNSQGIKYIRLSDKRFNIDGINLPDDFSLYGRSKNTILRKLPWSSGITNTNEIVYIGSDTPSNGMEIRDITIEGEMQRQFLVSEITGNAFSNYAINIYGSNLIIQNVNIENVVGGGIRAQNAFGDVNSTRIIINNSKVANITMTDNREYYPLICSESREVFVNRNTFQNAPGFIDASLIQNGIINDNIIQNTGSGLYIYGSTNLVSNPNVIRGPSDEFIPGPDILNSEYDSVNINIEPDVDFNSDVYTYQENGISFDLANTDTRYDLAYQINKLKKTNNVESLYDDPILNAANNNMIVNVVDVDVDPAQGQFKFRIPANNVNELLSTYDYDTLVAVDSNHVGLVYRAIFTEKAMVGNVTGITKNSNTEIEYILASVSNLSEQSQVVVENVLGATPDLSATIGTVTNINVDTITVEYDVNINTAGSTQTDPQTAMKVLNSFVLAKGRILNV